MSAFDALNLLLFVKRRIQSGASHKAIVEELRNYYPGVRAISIRICTLLQGAAMGSSIF